MSLSPLQVNSIVLKKTRQASSIIIAVVLAARLSIIYYDDCRAIRVNSTFTYFKRMELCWRQGLDSILVS